MMIKEIIEQRKLPDILRFRDGSDVTPENWEDRRSEIISILSECEYGTMPVKCGETQCDISDAYPFSDGESLIRNIRVKIPTPSGEAFEFNAMLNYPLNVTGKIPLFICAAFKYDFLFPIEEIISKGFAVASFIYTDVVPDNADALKNGLCAKWYKDGNREADESGAIGFWSLAASCVLDCVYDMDFIDKSRIGVIGHSRLGKTALWAGINDTRFTHVFPNNSGCAGVAVERGKLGERFDSIARVFPWWFNENMQSVSGMGEDIPFDQNFAVAAIAPRKVYCGSAINDTWSDPYSEFISIYDASKAWKMLGMDGFIGPEYYPEPGEKYSSGDAAYHLTKGGHSLCRGDWMKYCEFMKK